MRRFTLNSSAIASYTKRISRSSLESFPPRFAPSNDLINPIDNYLLRSRVTHVSLPFHESNVFDSASAGN